jgi:hypothetical protein
VCVHTSAHVSLLESRSPGHMASGYLRICILMWPMSLSKNHFCLQRRECVCVCVVCVTLWAGLPLPAGVHKFAFPCVCAECVCRPGFMPASLPRVCGDTRKLSFTCVVETLLGHFALAGQEELERECLVWKTGRQAAGDTLWSAQAASWTPGCSKCPR